MDATLGRVSCEQGQAQAGIAVGGAVVVDRGGVRAVVSCPDPPLVLRVPSPKKTSIK